MGKNDDLFEVDFGDSGVTPMAQSGVTQTDTSTVDDKPHVEQTSKVTKDGFELVENLLENSGEELEEKEEVEETDKTKNTPPSANDTEDASDSFAFVFAEKQQEEGNLSFELNTEEFKTPLS